MNTPRAFSPLLFTAALFAAHPLFFHALADEVHFIHDGTRYELRAENATPNELLAAIEEALQIPVERLPADGPSRPVHARSADLEKVLASFCESFVILYRDDDAGASIPSAVRVTPSDHTAPILPPHRQQTVQSHQLEQRLPIPAERPEPYAGIGAYIQIADDGTTLWLRPLSENTPAARCGIELGDKALSIDGTPIATFPSQDSIAAAIRGPVGSPVSLQIQKPDGTLVNLVVMRDVVASP